MCFFSSSRKNTYYAYSYNFNDKKIEVQHDYPYQGCTVMSGGKVQLPDPYPLLTAVFVLNYSLCLPSHSL